MVISGAALLAGCSGGAIGEHLPKAVGGLPEGVPQRPAIPADYPAVHDTAPPRTEAVLTDEQQIKLEQELIAARDRAAASRAAGGAANQ